MTVAIAIATTCTACGVCIVTCPERALLPAPARPSAHDERCTACFACIEVCPVDAITVTHDRGAARMNLHPIEDESYRILAGRIDLSEHAPEVAAVIARVVHASADLEFATSMRVSAEAVRAGIEAVSREAPVVTDVEMVRAGITSVPAQCYLGDVPTAPDGTTRSAAAMRVAAERHPEEAVVVIGCAPTALFEVVRLVDEGLFAPALVIGLPVGFVGAADSKDAAHLSRAMTITNVGEKGGSAVAAAALNAIVRLANHTNGRR